MKVQRLGEHDGALFEAAVRDVLLPEDDLHGSASRGHLARAAADAGCYFFVCLLDAAPIGFLSAYRFPDVERDGFLVYLYDIVVRPGHRRRGVAARMIDALKESSRLDGVSSIWVGTSLENPAAARTFETTGARRVSETYVEYVYDLGAPMGAA